LVFEVYWIAKYERAPGVAEAHDLTTARNAKIEHDNGRYNRVGQL